MGLIHPIKTNFTNGELDPLITMRSDLQLFENGASLIRNALPFPQGGVKRFPGLKFETPIPPAGQTKFLSLVSLTVVASGSGYSVGDIVTLTGGTFDIAAQAKVISVPGGGGSVTGLSDETTGTYAPNAPNVKPTPTSTNGDGSGATLNWDTGDEEVIDTSVDSFAGAGAIGYQVGDIITAVGGTFTTPASSEVIALGGAGSLITEIIDLGNYTVLPGTYDPFNQAYDTSTSTDGSGTGARMLLLVGVSIDNFSIFASGSGYAVNDILTLDVDGIVNLIDGQAKVTSISSSGGEVASIELIQSGDYSVLPPYPSETTTSGSGEDMTVAWSFEGQDNVQPIDFQFSFDENYLLVFTLGRIYIFRKEGTVSNPNPNHLVFTITNNIYSNQQLLEITWLQSLDVMLIFHQDVPIKQLSRFGEANWTLTDFEVTNIPSFSFGERETARLTVSNISGDVVGDSATLTAASASFVAADVGKFIRILTVSNGEGENYSSYYKITARSSTTVVTGRILSLPLILTATTSFVVGGPDWLLEEVEWSGARGYPRCGAFYQGRLCVAGSKDRPGTFWASRAGDIHDFNNGGTQDDFGITATIDSGEINTILHIFTGRHLLLFADQAEFYIPISDLDPITPNNVILRRTTTVGTISSLAPREVDGTVYFAQRGGEAYREFEFVDNVKAYDANTVSLFSSHLIRNPMSSAFKKSLNTQDGNYFWVINSDDHSLAAFSVLRSEVVNGWSLRTTDGDFRHAAVIEQTSYFHIRRYLDFPDGVLSAANLAADILEITTTDAHGVEVGDFVTLSNMSVPAYDNVYIATTVSAINKFGVIFAGSQGTATGDWSVEKDNIETFNESSKFDSAIIRTGLTSPVTGTSGLSHIEGKEVGIIVDDIYLGVQTVTNGAVSFDAPAADSFQVGLPFPNIIDDNTGEDTGFNVLIKTLPADILEKEGTLMGKQKSVPQCTVRYHDTQGFYVQGISVPFITLPENVLDAPIIPQTGQKTIKGLTGYNEFGQITIGQKEPFAMTILGLSYYVDY